MLHKLLKREGLVANHKRTERIYREEGLSLRVRRRKKLASCGRVELQRPGKCNEQWAIDFVSDALSSGRRLPHRLTSRWRHRAAVDNLIYPAAKLSVS